MRTIQLIITIIIVSLLYSCENNIVREKSVDIFSKSELGDTIWFKQFSHNIDNKDSLAFSFLYSEPVSAGTKSVIIDSNYAFFIDDYDKNIKKVNLLNGDLTVSKRLASQGNNKYLVDFVVVKNMIALSTFHGEVILLDKNTLKIIKTIEREELDGHNLVFKNGILGTDEYFAVFDEDGETLYKFSLDGSLINQKTISFEEAISNYQDTYFRQDGMASVRGKRFTVGDKGFTISIGKQCKISLIESYSDLVDLNIDGINIALTEDFLVYYKIKGRKLILFVNHLPDNCG